MQPFVYIMASQYHGTLYIGVTSQLRQRVWQHKHGITGGFTHQYNVNMLVYFEAHQTMYAAITREKQLKKWRREWKINLIEKQNPTWQDLWHLITDGSPPARG
ncbi:GIY-YIG nuclease family protein [Aeromonas caviae]|uniref:GIY-YIG nuclease family protein n=2 Tax=Aeromonas TaxID=642 RepID=UPI000DD9CACC|nr:GIY-YIG nuclease family protein [Aeromonas caviae]AXB01971.1 GIY-YIG nuclease family protein [Aeromonas caviae]MBL0538005.1 GIY-YIG nuclease family protein [Aeromonas caviae]BDS29930.1 endonuclease [Aeromonas caviae]